MVYMNEGFQVSRGKTPGDHPRPNRRSIEGLYNLVIEINITVNSVNCW